MSIRKIIGLVLIVFFGQVGRTQNYAISKSVFDGTGDAGSMVYGDLTIINNSSNTIQLFMHRFSQTLPANWYTCYCYINCYAKTQDSLYINMAAGQTVTVSIGFTTDTVPGIGYARFTLKEVGSSLSQDTLNFSGSTLASGISEPFISSPSPVFPNPCADKTTFTGKYNEPYTLEILDITGKVVNRCKEVLDKKSIINMESFPSGQYFIKATYRSGNVEIKKVIRN